jgi:probable rRNA maturation factor
LLYVAHGWLHLAGYDDLEPAARRRMRGAERRAMRILREGGVAGALRTQLKFGV